MPDTTLRLFALMRAIPREPYRSSTRELWQRLHDAGYRVSKRTVERDLSLLSTSFDFTAEAEAGTTYWFWPRAAVGLDIPSLDPAAALVLVMARDHLGSLLPSTALSMLQSGFARAEAVLDGMHNRRLGKWRKQVRVLPRVPHLPAPGIDQSVHSAVSDALLTGKRLAARYRIRGSQLAKDVELSPLALVAHDGTFYLLATAREHDDVLQYALHRFESAALLSSNARVLAGFDLDQYLQDDVRFSHPLSDKKLNLIVDFTHDAAELLRERPLSNDQVLAEGTDGRVRVQATVKDTTDLRWWLRSYGVHVEVIEPETLRNEMMQDSIAMVEQYRRSPLNAAT